MQRQRAEWSKELKHRLTLGVPAVIWKGKQKVRQGDADIGRGQWCHRQDEDTAWTWFVDKGCSFVVVTGKQKFLLHLTWMHPGRMCRLCEGDNKSLLKVREWSYNRSWWIRWIQRTFSLLQGVFKRSC
jgi:hypothetical protein